jgi:predicted permease
MNRVLNWFRLRRLESDLDRELKYHIDRRVSDLVHSGLPEPEAQRRAALELGGAGATQLREEVHDVWLTRWVRDFVYDLRFAARSFLRSPSFTATAVISLALGIGATTAIYSLVDEVILHALPVRDPKRLVLVDWKGDHVVGGFGSSNLMPYSLCRGLQAQIRLFDGVICRADIVPVNLSAGGDPKLADAELVSGSYFSVLGIGPSIGRVIEDDDDAAPGASPVVVLSYDFWQAQFGGSLDAVGRKILINRHPMTIVGVAARNFHGIDVGATPALWLPASMYAQAIPGAESGLHDRPTRWMQILARLRPELTAAQAQVGLQPWFKTWLEENTGRPGFPVITADRRRRYFESSLQLAPAPQGYSPLRRSLSQPLWILFAVTGVLLGLGCLNVAGLFLARGSARSREIRTRLALGASRGRIGRQFLTDTVLFALTGGALGIALAPLAVRALIAFLPGNYADAHALRSVVSLRLLAFAFLASVVSGLASGLAPALHAGRNSVISGLGERAGTAFGGVRLRKCIVTLQVAFSLILVVGAALFLRTLDGLRSKGPGFDTTHLVSFSLAPQKNGYSRADSARFIRRIDAEIRDLPVTRSSAVIRYALLSGGSWSNPFTIQAAGRIVTDHDIRENAISPGFFATLGVPILAGRNFDERDIRPAGEIGRRSAIVNQAFVRRYLPAVDPIGVRIGEGSYPDVKPEIVIVGVVADFSYRNLREGSEQVFFPIFEGDDFAGTFYVKVRGTSEQALQSIRQIVGDADPQLPILSFRTLDDQVNRSLNTERMLAALFSAFGVLALLLSVVGLYGVMSFVVTQRTREIGIRMALGATPLSTLGLVLRDALAMIAAGTAIALPCVWTLGRLVESQLYDVKSTDPVTLLGATLVLCSATLAAAFVPARRASAVNPTDALRFE